MNKRIALICICCLLLTACRANNSSAYAHATIREQLDNDEQIVQGYVKENGMVKLHEQRSQTVIEVYVIADYFDLNGEYIETLVSYSKSSEQKWSGTIKELESEYVFIDESQVIMLPDDSFELKSIELSKQQERQLQNHISMTINRIEEWKESSSRE